MRFVKKKKACVKIHNILGWRKLICLLEQLILYETVRKWICYFWGFFLKAPIHQAFRNALLMLILRKTQQGISYLHFKFFLFFFFWPNIFSSFVHNCLFVFVCFLLLIKSLSVFIVSKFHLNFPLLDFTIENKKISTADLL